MKWLNQIETCQDPKESLRVFCHNYYYFSLNQVLAFSEILSKIDPFDRETLAILAQTIYDELGCGDAEAVHSVLFAKFMRAVGANPDNQPLSHNVLPHIRNYIDELRIAFSGDSLPKALASYVFLEKSATETYSPLFDTIKKAIPELSADDLYFFSMHATLEPEHEKAARALVAKQRFSLIQQNEYEQQYHHLASCWELFWQDIYNDTMKIITPSMHTST